MDLNGKTKNELESLLRQKEEVLRKFRFDMAGSKIKNIKEGNVLKKDIAKILTEINKTSV
ncbi:MAG: 50S ribosomal protein L29 [Candidatus Paceibacterota bacterium]|jgi:ribosomal protein L29